MASGLLLCVIFELFIYLSNLSNATNYEWTEIYANDGASSDQFGYSVGISGSYAIVGAPYNDDLGSSSGCAYIFIQDSVTGNWTQSQKLLASDGAANDYFGHSVSISANVSIIGAYGDDDMASNAGAAYIFTKDETTGNFSQTIKLLPNDTSAKYCGFSVSISGDSAIMGCYYSSISRAYIFEYDEIEDEWQQSAMFKGSGYFGYSVSIYDSTYAIVGALYDDTEATNAGAAFIYTKNELTSGWGYTDSIYASDASSSDYFGYTVDICKHYAIIGAPRDDDYGSSSGAAYIFYRNSNTWNQTQKLAPSDLDYADFFGASVSLNCDSKQNYYAIVGAYLDDDKGTNAGAAYLFTLETLDFDEDYWNDTAKLTASDGSSNDYFGFSVCASGDNVIIGSRYNDNKASNAGSAYIVGGVSSFYNGSIIVECNDELECANEEEIDCDIIYCRGYESCKNSIMNVSDDCYCTGDNACVQSEIFSSNVECNGYLSCNETIIESNTTECNGYYGCIDSIISSTSLLKSSSYRSCENCSISNTPNIYAYGELSFFNAQISTDGVNNFNLLSRGVHALKDASLYCYSGSTCVVKCGNGPTCSGLNYYCDNGANCRLNCNETCSTCPDIIDGTFISTLLGKSKETLVVNKKEKEKEKVEYFAINSNSNSNHYSDGKNQIYVLTIYAIITTIYIIKGKFVKIIDNNHDSNYSYSVISDP